MPSPRRQDSEKQNHSFNEFGGVNTQASRESIQDNEFAWLENVMPIGHGHMLVLPGPSAVLASIASGTCFYMTSANITNVDYMFMFSTDGSAYQVNLTSNAVVKFANIGTFSGSGTQACQWKNERLLIIDAKGYYSWNTTTLQNLNGTVLSITLTAYGQGFTSVPTVTLGGPGTGAAATAIVGLGAATIGAGGTGYYVGDVLSVVGGTVNTAAQVSVTAITTGGVVSGITLKTPGDYTVPPVASPVTCTGGFGTGFTLTPTWSVVTINVTAGGLGYTTAPTVTISGGVGGSNNVQHAAVASSGSNYTIGDVLTVVGGTSTTAAQLTVSAVNYIGNGVTAGGIVVSTPGSYTVLPTNPVSVTGGTGTLATFNLTWQNNTNASATAYVSVVPSGGTSIASYSGRVWVASARTVVFSAPNTYLDFSTVNAGGSFIITDETLHSNINQLSTANNFLYITGDTSINVVGDVRVVTGITVFSNTNVSASIGSTFPASVVPYYRAVWFANRYGVYALYGSTTQKASDALDGLFPFIDLSEVISAGQFIVNNVLCLSFLVEYDDPVNGPRALLLVYANKKWFFSSQGDQISLIANSPPLGVPTLYGTDGIRLYKLFSNTTAEVSHTIKSKLWDLGDPLRVKQVLKFGIETVIGAVVTPSVGISIDTENNSADASTVVGNITIWTSNNVNKTTWTTDSGTVATWFASGYAFNKFDISTYGYYIGFTVTSMTPQIDYNAFHLQYEMRASW